LGNSCSAVKARKVRKKGDSSGVVAEREQVEKRIQQNDERGILQGRACRGIGESPASVLEGKKKTLGKEETARKSKEKGLKNRIL